MRLLPAYLLLFLLVLPGWTSAQIYVEGRVLDAKSREPLPFVNVTYNNLRSGTVGDIDGYFQIEVSGELSSLEFSYVGYAKKSIAIKGTPKKPLTVLLERNDITLMEAVVLPGENPAHRIIRNASDARKTNDPLELNSFQYTSYNKLLFTVDVDSLPIIDSIGDIDSSNYEAKEFFDRSHLFLMESATERSYIKGSRDHENVLASRISGFKNPTFTLVGTQLQSFSFYKDELEVLFTRYINPLRSNSMREYFFLLEDTLFSEADADTVYVVSFRPKKTSRVDLLSGSLYIGTNDWALRNVLASRVDTIDDSDVPIEVKIQQKYERYGEHWFPVQLLTDITLGSVSVNGAVPQGFGRTYIKDVKVEVPLNKKDIPRLELTMDEDVYVQDEAYWNELRIRPLDSVEAETYVVIDSIGEEIDLQRNVDFLTNLFRGKLRYRWVDFDLNRLVRYNLPYEGFRLGIGAHTNERLWRNVRLGGYFGYGTKDFDWKYGGDLVYRPAVDGPFTFRLAYDRDLAETGGRNYLINRKPGLFSGQNFRWFNIERMDLVERFEGAILVDLLPNLKLGVSSAWERRESQWPSFQNEQVTRRPEWEGNILGLGLEWAPGDRYMAGPGGRRRLQTTYPLFTLDYRFGMSSEQAREGLENNFHRLSLRAVQLWKNLRHGDLRVEAELGSTLGSRTPAAYLFAPQSNLRTRQFQEEPSFGLGSPYSFETLFNNEFTSDLQTQLFIDYSLPNRILKIGNWSPTISLQQRFLWGRLSNADPYIGVYADVKAPDEGFYESGVEFKQLFNTLGLGFYFRYGPYARQEILQNFSIKLTSSGLF